MHWLPVIPDWADRLGNLASDTRTAWREAVALANSRIDFIQTNALDVTVGRLFSRWPSGLTTQPVRLAVLSTSTFAHLVPAIRIAGLRRGIWIDVYETDFGQYMQELTDENSALQRFRPTVVLVALDSYHLGAGLTAGMSSEEAGATLDEMKAHIQLVWQLVREAFHCPVIHQTTLPVHLPLLGNNEHRLPGSRAGAVNRLNNALRTMAVDAGVDLLTIDDRVVRDGIERWHDPALWHRAKQEIRLPAAPLYGDMVGRLLAAQQGLSYKCLVLDLDNTLWGGVIGDDGLSGIILGSGSALGEAYSAFQAYVRQLSRRGVILAVCSKNDEANALEPFEKHPDMVLQRSDIACFIANWSDKASNIRSIAQELGIGLDSLVLIDDNPFERSLVRHALPMVAVPEVTDDPTYFARAIADAGYFEGCSVTEEDRRRTEQYQGNKLREALKVSATDLSSYLRSLDMRLMCEAFDDVGLRRIVQLINRSNQFNLTTRRYTEDDIRAIMAEPAAFGLQLRLLDRFGDNGVIAIIIGRLTTETDLLIDTWLMSCRVLGRQVEQATLNLIAQEARKLGASRLIGEYIPTPKNSMVRDHYVRLGFIPTETTIHGGRRAVLDLHTYRRVETFIDVIGN